MFICKEDNRRRSGLRQDCQMPQMNIYTSHCHELFLNSSLHGCAHHTERQICLALSMILPALIRAHMKKA